MKKACAKIISINLTEDQKLTRNGLHPKFWNKTEETPVFLTPWSPAKKCGLFQYDLEMKSQFMQWKTPASLRPNKARMSKSNIKIAILVFFDIK